MATEKMGEVETNGESREEPKSPTSELKPEDGSIEEISPLSDENVIKKTKKEKVKKKWSFRSISFGKKDKLKPNKTEDNPENTSAVNGTEEEKSSHVNIYILNFMYLY